MPDSDGTPWVDDSDARRFFRGYTNPLAMMGVALDRYLPGRGAMLANEAYVLFPQCFLLSLYVYYSGIVILITPFAFEASDQSVIGFNRFVNMIHDDIYRCNPIQGIGKSWLLIAFLFP